MVHQYCKEGRRAVSLCGSPGMENISFELDQGGRGIANEDQGQFLLKRHLGVAGSRYRTNCHGSARELVMSRAEPYMTKHLVSSSRGPEPLDSSSSYHIWLFLVARQG